MSAIEIGVRLTPKNILLLTDFSEGSELAVPFATAIAREYESKLYAMHVLTPLPPAYATLESAAVAIEGLEEEAQAGMQRLDAQLVGVAHETMLVRGESVWPSVEQALSCGAAPSAANYESGRNWHSIRQGCRSEETYFGGRSWSRSQSRLTQLYQQKPEIINLADVPVAR
jgi:hypothetical protein